MKLLDEIKVGNLTLKNRVMFPPLTTGYEERDGSIGERSFNFYTRLANPTVDLVEKIRQLMIAAQAAANLAERKMEEANEVVEVEVITADSQSAVEAWRTAESKTREAERMMEKVRNASKRAGEKGAEDAVNQAQQLLSQARAALELANEAKEDAEQLLKSVNKKCAACCVVM